MSTANQETPLKKPTFEELKVKYAGAYYLVELANQKAGYLKIEDITGPNFNEKLKVAFHMIRSSQYALADKDKKIISEVSLNNADMAAILKNAQVQSANDKEKISELQAKLAAYEAQNPSIQNEELAAGAKGKSGRPKKNEESKANESTAVEDSGSQNNQ